MVTVGFGLAAGESLPPPLLAATAAAATPTPIHNHLFFQMELLFVAVGALLSALLLNRLMPLLALALGAAAANGVVLSSFVVRIKGEKDCP